MTSSEDPREYLMWEKELIVTSEELKSYAANYPPMGVYIPRGRVKVPHIRSRRTQQISQSARGKPNSPNLLMIRPNCKQSSGILPSIDVYASRQYDVTATRHQPTSSRTKTHEPEIKPYNLMKGQLFDPMASQLLCPNNDVPSTAMLDYAKSFMMNNRAYSGQSAQNTLPPPYVDANFESRFLNKHNNPDMTSLMTQDMGYPLGHQYYQHLSAIAAMAWSDCNQATEKLRRIYEETAHLSRTYDPFGLFAGGIAGYPHAHMVPASPAPGNTASMMGPKDSRADIMRYQQIARDHQKYIDQTKNKYANMGSNFENPNCDVKINKQLCNMTSQSPLPGIAMFNPQSMMQQYQTVPCDVTNQRNYSRQNELYAPKTSVVGQKRKRCDQQDLMTNLGSSCDQKYKVKLPRIDTAYFPKQEPQMTSHTKSMLPESLMYNPSIQPPPYESVLQSGCIPDLLKKTVKTEKFSTINFSDIMRPESNDDVANTSSNMIEKFCLPSVSCSPSQSFVNLPFVLQ